MREKRVTTTFAVKNFKDDPLIEAGQSYPLLGDAITKSEKECILEDLIGLSQKWQCDAKALTTLLALRKSGRHGLEMHIGSLFIWSKDHLSSYGFAYNPPLEFHCWVYCSKSNAIIDFALPGVIMVGLEMRDDVGPMLVVRKPVILAEEPLEYLQYRSVGRLK